MSGGASGGASPPAPVVCSRCGRQEVGPPLGWSHATTDRGPVWLCDACTRGNVRSIEGRLDEAWW